jgi:hypothetical protein
MSTFQFPLLFAIASSFLLLGGCGTTKSSQATEQLLLSDSIDRSVAAIDFRPLSGKTVFVDTKHIETAKDRGFLNAPPLVTNSPYVVSSIRQQLSAAGCKLMDKVEDAEIICEPRIGVLAADAHQVSFGLPSSNHLNSAAEMVPNAPRIPILPELSLARRETQSSATKVAVFAYDRVTRQPYWQSGLSLAQSTGRDTWVFGIGPFHRSAVRKGEIIVRNEDPAAAKIAKSSGRPEVDFDTSMVYQNGWPIGISPAPRTSVTQEVKPENGEVKPQEGSPPTSTPLSSAPVVRASYDQPITLPPPAPGPQRLGHSP